MSDLVLFCFGFLCAWPLRIAIDTLAVICGKHRPRVAAMQARAKAAEAALARAYELGRDDTAAVAFAASPLKLEHLDAIGSLVAPADLAKRVGVSHE